MVTGKSTIAILLDQLKQSKVMFLSLLMLFISYFGYMITTWPWAFEYLFYVSIYFSLYLSALALTTALHEREHIVKLKELGYEAINFKVHRIGNVSFWIENQDQLSSNEIYQNASAPFLKPIVYIFEVISLLFLILVNALSPFPLNLVLLVFTLLAFVSLIGSFSALLVVRRRKTSGFCVRFARVVTSRGDIDEITSWNRDKRMD